MKKPDTTKLTIRLPREQVEFAKRFAKANGLTVTDVIGRYLQRLQDQSPGELSPEVREIIGLIPSGIDLDSVRYEYLRKKHGP